MRGFTLIELLVILSIIISLVIIAIPSYYIYVNSAKRGKALNDARQCLNIIAEHLLNGGSISSLNLPSNCTANSENSCTCTHDSFSFTCSVSDNGSVVCSES